MHVLLYRIDLYIIYVWRAGRTCTYLISPLLQLVIGTHTHSAASEIISKHGEREWCEVTQQLHELLALF